jgi:hypothetical protein
MGVSTAGWQWRWGLRDFRRGEMTAANRRVKTRIDLELEGEVRVASRRNAIQQLIHLLARLFESNSNNHSDLVN